jgi:hypothetical protein
MVQHCTEHFLGNEWLGTFCNKKKNGELYWESASWWLIMKKIYAIFWINFFPEKVTWSGLPSGRLAVG